MAGGIVGGASQVASGGFKIAAKLGVKTGRKAGIKLGKVKLLSPNSKKSIHNGGTLLKIGNTFRIDVGSNSLLHMHLPGIDKHLPIGTVISGLYGGIRKWLEK